MRAYDDILIFQSLVLAGNHGDDVMSDALLVLPVGEVVIVASFLLAFDYRLEVSFLPLTIGLSFMLRSWLTMNSDASVSP